MSYSARVVTNVLGCEWTVESLAATTKAKARKKEWTIAIVWKAMTLATTATCIKNANKQSCKVEAKASAQLQTDVGRGGGEKRRNIIWVQSNTGWLADRPDGWRCYEGERVFMMVMEFCFRNNWVLVPLLISICVPDDTFFILNKLKLFGKRFIFFLWMRKN